MNTPTPNDHTNEDHLGPLSHLPTIEAIEFANWPSDGGLTSKETPSCRAGQESAANIEKSDLRLLQAIADNPGLASSRYPKMAGMSPRKAVDVRQRLVQQGLIRETEIQTKARGRAAIVLTPTDKAAAALLTHGEDQDQGVPGA